MELILMEQNDNGEKKQQGVKHLPTLVHHLSQVMYLLTTRTNHLSQSKGEMEEEVESMNQLVIQHYHSLM